MEEFGKLAVDALGLKEHTREHLHLNGIRTVDDMLKIDESKLKEISKITDLAFLFAHIKSFQEEYDKHNYSNLLNFESQAGNDLTFEHDQEDIKDVLRSMDHDYIKIILESNIKIQGEDVEILLNKTFKLGQVIELCSFPGAGKTNICHQLAVNVQFPQELDGVDGECLYIDTEGSFSTKRIQAMIEKFRGIIFSKIQGIEDQKQTQKIISRYTREKILSRIHVVRVCSEESLNDIYEQIPTLIEERGRRIKLLVIDSVAFLHRLKIAEAFIKSQYSNQNKTMLNILMYIQRIATSYHMNVVLTNMFTTKVKDERFQSHKPLFGPIWTNMLNDRIMLKKENYSSGGDGTMSSSSSSGSEERTNFSVLREKDLLPRGQRYSITETGISFNS